MKSIYTGLALSLFWAGAVAAQDQAGSWRKYTNERFGFSLLLPSRVFAVEKQSDAGDGVVFVSKDGEARLLVGALQNADAQTPSRYQDYLAKQSYADYDITYRRGGDSWFVLSGEGNGKTFDEKVMFSCSGRLINSFVHAIPDRTAQDVRSYRGKDRKLFPAGHPMRSSRCCTHRRTSCGIQGHR